MNATASRHGDLTARQQAIWEFYATYQLANGRPPTIREAMTAHGMASPNGMVSQLTSMVRKGMIVRTELTARGYQAVHRDRIAVEPFADGARLLLAGVPCALTWDEVERLHADLGRALEGRK